MNDTSFVVKQGDLQGMVGVSAMSTGDKVTVDQRVGMIRSSTVNLAIAKQIVIGTQRTINK